MKSVLKISLYIVLGMVTGCVATGYIMNRFHRQRLAELYSMQLGLNSIHALQLRGGLVDIVTKNLENSLSQYVLGMSRDSELRKANTADVALASTKRFYICTKTEIPQEIAEIMENVTPLPCSEDE